jgi:hypothetical protein
MKAGMMESENMAIARQRLVETRFRSNEYAGINQRVTQRLIIFLGNGCLKRILMSTEIQQKFRWRRGILGSPDVFATTVMQNNTGTVRHGVLFPVLMKPA